MKKLRFVFLIVFIFGFLLLLTSCTCDPSEHMWYIERCEQNTGYLNGVEATEIYNKSPMLEEPFGGMENGVVSIVFQKDGSVIFTPGTGEILNGKYTLKNNGMADTSFTVTLENGESFSGIAVNYYYGRDLKFEFRGMSYWFEEEYHTADLLYEEKMEQFKSWLRYDAENDRLNKGTIERVFDRYELKTEEGTVVALDDSVAIQCVSMDLENNLVNLDKILSGECFYVKTTTYDGKDKIEI